MKFYCVRDKKRYKYENMIQICNGCTICRCPAHTYAEAHDFTSKALAMMGTFSSWMETRTKTEAERRKL